MRTVCATGVLALLFGAGCADSAPARGASDGVAASATLSLPALSDTRVTNYPGLPNVVAYAPGLYSGGLPEGDTGFQTLERLGIRTVISVDGMLPDVEAAQRHGLRYVHLPIGYDGMDEKRTLEIARAVRDLPGPIYIHCHHGKHRSAAAAGATAVTLGDLSPQAALAKMHISGTAPAYTGLFACVQVAKAASKAELDGASNEFPSRWHTGSAVQRMVQVDQTFDHLKEIQKAGWKTPAGHPDLVPVSEAAQLADHFRTLHDIPFFAAKPSGFWQHAELAARESQALEDDLNLPDANAGVLDARMTSLSANCVACHHEYRD
ncbi:MAG: hypothetical protein GC200_03740 [Tepidisphaera sp.]|nr:hypothetical protein [Tepidisphaera sp.]